MSVTLTIGRHFPVHFSVLGVAALLVACTLPHRVLPTAPQTGDASPLPAAATSSRSVEPRVIPAVAATGDTLPSAAPGAMQRIADLPVLPPRQRPAHAPLGGTAASLPFPSLPQIPSQRKAESTTKPETGKAVDRARAALADLKRRANLDDAQVRTMQSAEAALARGDASAAATRATRLDATVRAATKTWTVAAGDTLSGIADAVYDNHYLWPLILHANARLLPRPADLRVGQVLAVPLYPTLDEVAAALRQAHEQSP